MFTSSTRSRDSPSSLSPDLVPECSVHLADTLDGSSLGTERNTSASPPQSNPIAGRDEQFAPMPPPQWLAAVPWPATGSAGGAPPPPLSPADFARWYEKHFLHVGRAEESPRQDSSRKTSSMSASPSAVEPHSLAPAAWDELFRKTAGRWPRPQDVPMPSLFPLAPSSASAVERGVGISTAASFRVAPATIERGTNTSPCRSHSARETTGLVPPTGLLDETHSSSVEQLRRSVGTQAISEERRQEDGRQKESGMGLATRPSWGTSERRLEGRRQTLTGASRCLRSGSARVPQRVLGDYYAVLEEARSLYRRLSEDYQAFQSDPEKFHERLTERGDAGGAARSTRHPGTGSRGQSPALRGTDSEREPSTPLPGSTSRVSAERRHPIPMASRPVLRSSSSRDDPPPDSAPTRQQGTTLRRGRTQPRTKRLPLRSPTSAPPPRPSPSSAKGSTAVAHPPSSAGGRSELYQMLFQLESQWQRLQSYKHLHEGHQNKDAMEHHQAVVDRNAITELIRDRKAVVSF